MAVVYTQGDLLTWPADITVLAHGVSLQRVLGAGLALQIAERYPEAKQAYLDAFEPPEANPVALGLHRGPQLGDLIVAPVEGDTKRICHCVTQDGIGRDRRRLDYEALYRALEQLKTLLEGAAAEGRHWVLGMPAWIGCGLAGGAPRIVEAMVTHLFHQSPVKCVVVQQPSTSRTL